MSAVIALSARRVVPVAGLTLVFSHVLDATMLAGPAITLARALEPAFLTEAGWDPGMRVLWLPAQHPLLGRTLCRVDGCPSTVHGTKIGGLCWQCFSRLSRAGMSIDEIVAAKQLPPLPNLNLNPWTGPVHCVQKGGVEM